MPRHGRWAFCKENAQLIVKREGNEDPGLKMILSSWKRRIETPATLTKDRAEGLRGEAKHIQCQLWAVRRQIAAKFHADDPESQLNGPKTRWNRRESFPRHVKLAGILPERPRRERLELKP